MHPKGSPLPHVCRRWKSRNRFQVVHRILLNERAICDVLKHGISVLLYGDSKPVRHHL